MKAQNRQIQIIFNEILRLIIIVALCFNFHNCSNTEIKTIGLENRYWDIEVGIYNRKKIAFIEDKEFKQDQSGLLSREILGFKLNSDSSAILPGISAKIHAKWFRQGDKIFFYLDSAFYNLYYKKDKKIKSSPYALFSNSDIKVKKRLDSIYKIDSIKLMNFKNENPIMNHSLDAEMKIYSSPFKYNLSIPKDRPYPRLELVSNTTKIICINSTL